MKNDLMAIIEKWRGQRKCQSTWNRSTGKLYNLKKTEKKMKKIMNNLRELWVNCKKFNLQENRVTVVKEKLEQRNIIVWQFFKS